MKNLKIQAKELLLQNGLKVTAFRLKLTSLFQMSDGPLSALQIQNELLKMKFDQFDRATLFRNLKAMEQVGLLESTEFGQGASFYSLRKSKASHEHHVFCIRCEKTEPIQGCGAKVTIDRATQKGYKVLKHRVELMGICPACA